MELFDFIVLAPITLFAFRGYSNGLVKEIMSIIGIVVAVFISFSYLEIATEWLKVSYNFSDSIAPLVAGLGLFSLVLFIANIAVAIINRFLDVIALTSINKMLGLAFGGLKATIIISQVLIFLAGFQLPEKDTRSKSLTYTTLIRIAPASYSIIAAVWPGASNFGETVQKSLDDNNPLKSFF